MSSKRRLRRKIQKRQNICQNKKTYPNETEAMKAKKGFQRNRDPWIRYYLCDLCGKYHLTHTKPRAKRKLWLKLQI